MSKNNVIKVTEWVMKKFPFNEDFAEAVGILCMDANDEAARIGDHKEVYFQKPEGGALSLVNFWIKKWAFQRGANFTNLAADIIFDLSTKNKFTDGNKRTALLTVLYFFKMSGFWVVQPNPVDYWDKLIENVVEEFEQSKDPEEIKQKLREQILENLVSVDPKYEDVTEETEIDPESEIITAEYVKSNMRLWQQEVREDEVIMESLKRLSVK
ncbi:hypothetical protein [Mycoplasma yeatsii]|uniref:hypothetical protein n=1 Tax=Mycoplasma yeatsii TaxID=51365 RepID=UPI0005B2475C|nr:hypothetical protein [Mycoplasma yeatsii]AJM72225.1 hypothetical protein MYE_03940 [Mycoplasma yeatsii GM274B]